jgi:hypothetical protein
MHQGNAAWTHRIDKRKGLAAWISSMEMLNGHAAGVMSAGGMSFMYKKMDLNTSSCTWI